MSSYKKTIILGLDTTEYITGMAEAKKANEELKDSLDEAGEATEKFNESTEDTGKSIDELKDSALDAVTNLATASASLIALGKGLSESVTGAAEFGKELTALSDQTGLSVEAIQALQYAAEQMGVSSDTMIDSISGMTETMDKARDGSEELQSAFSRLGVKYTEHGNQLRDSQEVYLEVLDALSNISNEEERAALATDIFGSAARELTPVLDAGTQGLYNLMSEASEYGVIVSGDTVAASAEFAKSLETLESRMDAVKVQLGSALMPLLETVLGVILAIPTPVLEIGAALLVVVAGLVAVAKAIEAFSSLGNIMASFGAQTAATTLQIVAIVVAITALIAVIAVLVGYGDQITSTMSALKGTTSVTQYNARGTDFFTGGETWVGENGPELVTLPRGSRITPANESAAGSTNIYNVTIDAKNVREFNDIVKLAQHEQTSYRVGTVRV